jgi:hypothetical protein
MAVVHTTTTAATSSFPPYSLTSHFQLIQVNNGRFIALLSTRFVVLGAVVIAQVFLLNLFVRRCSYSLTLLLIVQHRSRDNDDNKKNV